LGIAQDTDTGMAGNVDHAIIKMVADRAFAERFIPGFPIWLY